MSQTVFDWIAFNARRRPTHIALGDLASDRRFTYAEMNLRVERAARFLSDRGIRKGSRVGVLARNSTDMIELLFASKRIGAIMVPMNWRLATSELQHVVNDSAPAILFSGTEFIDAARQIIDPSLIVTLTGDGSLESGYEKGLHRADLDSTQIWPTLTNDDPWLLIYTSGTTGRSKGAILTHGTVFYNMISLNMFSRLTCDSITLTFNPLFHTGGLSAYSIPALHTGATVYVMRQFDAGQVNALLSEPTLGITHINSAPTMFLLMSQHPSFAAADYSRLVCATIGGEAVPTTLVDRYRREKNLSLQTLYGLTEGGPVLTAVDIDSVGAYPGSVGTSLLYTEMRLVGTDGTDVATGEVGEIWARGPNVSPGYWHNPEKTKEAFEGDWLKTGDAGRRDASGHYYLADRWKDMYISGAENVYPAEIENVLYQLDGIAEAAVIGVPDERWGETGRAVVVLKSGADLDETAIIAHCRTHLAKFKVPTSVVFTNELPRSGGGKVVKPDLRTRFGKPTTT
ncbi:MAG: long-chain fatty acid--CoA ligase [Alphaproteobacteria bacterium]